MKRIYVGLTVAALAAFVGCEGAKSTSGGPGATNRGTGGTGTGGTKGPIVGKPDNSFSLSTPTLSTKLKQSESEVVKISIKRGNNFDQDVSLKFEGLPKGVTIEPLLAAIKHGEEEAKVTVKAAADAAVGDFTVKVIGHPKEGPDAMSEMKLTISKK